MRQREPELAAVMLELFARALPAPVSLDDNFFDAGGDSLVAFSVAAAAHKRGVPIGAADILRGGTAREVARIAARKLDGTGPSTTGGSTRRFFPLLPGQRATVDHLPLDRVYNSNAELFALPSGIEPEMVAEAVAATVARHDGLRTRFTQSHGAWRQEFVPPKPLDIPVVDLSGLDPAARAARAVQVASSLRSRLTLRSPSPLSTALFRLGAGEDDRLLVAVHHLVCDGISWQVILDDLDSALEACLNRMRPQLPDVPTPLPRWIELLEQEATMEEGLDEDLHRHTARPWNQIARLESRPPHGEGQLLRIARILDVDTTRLLEHRPTADAQPHDMMVAALARAVASRCRSPFALVDVATNGREETLAGQIDLSRTVGFLVYPTPLLVDGRERELVRRVVDERRANDLRFGLRRYLSHRWASALSDIPRSPFSVNYRSRLGGGATDLQNLRSLPVSLGPVLGILDDKIRVIGDVLPSGEMEVSLEGSTSHHAEDALHRLFETFLIELNSLVTDEGRQE